MGQRCIDIHRFLADVLLPVRSQELDGAHVVQTIGQLDEDGARVPGDGENQLAVGFGFSSGLIDFPDAADLGYAVDHVGHFITEAFTDVIQRVVGVLDYVVHHGGNHRIDVQPQVGQDQGNGQGMGEEGFAALAHLIPVSLLGERVTGPEFFLFRPGIVFLHALPDGLYHLVQDLVARTGSVTGGSPHFPPEDHSGAAGLISTNNCWTGS